MGLAKVTIIGDMMCEPLLLKAARVNDGYDFSSVYSHVKDLFQQSDFVIGNLETPLAGEKSGYVHDLFSFNAPVEFAVAAKEAGVSLVSTANNHCMDRGFDGMLETVKQLDKVKLAHVGTYLSPDQEERTFFRDVKGQTIAVVAYTYGTNYSMHHRLLDSTQETHINLLRPYKESVFLQQQKKKRLTKKIFNKALTCLKREHQIAIKKALGMTYNSPRKDDSVNLETAAPYYEKVREEIKEAAKKADIVLFLPHMGGQFNQDPGLFSLSVMKMAKEAGAHAIISSHPHVVQKAELSDGVPLFFSIGNFCMSPNSVYLLHEDLPEYGIAVHLYIDGKTIVRITFSILKCVEEAKSMLTVWPVEKLAHPCEEEIKKIYHTVTGKALLEPIIRSEYEV